MIVGSNVKVLPEEVDNDIDFIVDDDSFDSIEEIIKEFSDKEGLIWVQMFHHESKAKYFVLQKVEGEDIISIEVDFCSSYIREGRFFLSAAEMLEDRQETKGKNDLGSFYIPAAHKEFLYYLLKKVDKAAVEEDQFQHLLEKWSVDKEKSKKELSRFFSPKFLEQIAEAMDRADFQSFKSNLSSFRKDFNSKLPFKLKYLLLDLGTKFRRILQPTGLSIAFFGADGSGKTTVINQVLKGHAAFRNQNYFHLSPKFIYRGGPTDKADDPHGQTKRSALFSTLKLGYLFLEYTLGWFINVQPLLIRSRLVIFDRYYHDILVDPVRYRYGGTRFLARFVGSLIPKPDIFILLDAPSEVLQQRKNEVPMEESKRARNAYLQFIQNSKRGVVVNSNQGVHQVELQVREAIMDHMQKRILRFYL